MAEGEKLGNPSIAAFQAVEPVAEIADGLGRFSLGRSDDLRTTTPHHVFSSSLSRRSSRSTEKPFSRCAVVREHFLDVQVAARDAVVASLFDAKRAKTEG